jgi:hypothetical protein
VRRKATHGSAPEGLGMNGRHWGLAIICSLILMAFAYSFWANAQKSPVQGGPHSITD